VVRGAIRNVQTSAHVPRQARHGRVGAKGR
jgi:hypothetical protein